MEDIDVRVIIKRLFKQWPVLLVSLLLTFSIGFFYLKSVEKKYLVASFIQLKDQSLGQKESTKEKFISGINTVETASELEDELVILSSFSTFKQTVLKLNNYTSLYRYDNTLGKFGKTFSDEIYQEDISIILDSNFQQLVNVPIHISTVDETTFLVNIEAEDASLYNFKNHTNQVNIKNYSLEQKGTLGKPFSSPYASFTIKPEPGFIFQKGKNYYFIAHTLIDLTDSYRNRTVFSPASEKSNVIKVEIKGALPNKEIVFLNALANQYIENDLLKKTELGQKTISFIDKQLINVSDTLHTVENSLEQFRANSQVVDVSTTAQTLTEQMNELMKKESELKTQNQYYQYIGKYIAKNKNVDDLPAPSSVGIQDPSLNNLLAELATLSGEKLSVAYNAKGNKNPIMNVIDDKITYTKKAISDNIQNLISSSDISIKENQERIAEIRQNINRLPRDEKNLKGIQRQFYFNDNIYNYLLEKRAEAGINVATNMPSKYIIDPARQMGNKPLEPNRIFVFLICLVAGLILPVGFIFTRDYFKDVIENEKQLAALISLPILESIPSMKGKSSYSKDGSLIPDPFRFLRHQINFLSQSQKVKVLGITSAVSAEGKTFCALNLATSFASTGKRTLLIDFDFYHSTLSALLKMKEAPGLKDYLMTGNSDIIQPCKVKNLFLVSAGEKQTTEANIEDLLDENKLEKFLKNCRDDFDYIILDTPPLGITPEYLSVCNTVDYTVLVVRSGFTEKAQLARVCKLFEQNSIKGGVVLNGVDMMDQYEGYVKRIAAS